MKVLVTVVAVLAVTSVAYAIPVGGDSHDQNQGQGQNQSQDLRNTNTNNNLNVTNSMTKSSSYSDADAKACAEANQLSLMDASTESSSKNVISSDDDTNVDASEQRYRWETPMIAPVTPMVGTSSISANTPFGGATAAIETTTGKQVCYSKEILAGVELIGTDEAKVMYLENLQAMKKSSKPRYGLLTQLAKLLL